MTKDDIIRMARKAGIAQYGLGWTCWEGQLERFAALVAAAERDHLLSTEIHSCHANCQRFACVQTRNAVKAEREACAQVCDEIDIRSDYDTGFAFECAAAIRARGQQ